MNPTKYICYRCNCYDTTRFNDIRKHLSRKYTCNKQSELVLLSDDQILVLTLMPYHNDSHSIEPKDIEFLSKSDIINKNKNELFDEIVNIEKMKCKTCKYCNKDFNLILDLKKHVILECFYNDLCKRKSDDVNINNSNNTSHSHNTNHSYNNYTNCDLSNNVNNNINLYLGLKTPVPFEENWDLSQLTTDRKSYILFSEFMYTNLLNSILENEINNNVIINSDNKSGMVYMNHDDKYISMKAKQITEKTMEKLHDQLKNINNECKHFAKIVNYNVARNDINSKFSKYNEDNELKKNVNNVICESFRNKKKHAEKLSENVVRMDELNKKILENENNDSDCESNNIQNNSFIMSNSKRGY